MADVNQAGLKLIQVYEGLRLDAYRDAVGIWTIGYGHTSMAGKPEVVAGLRISRAEAASILARDVETFARGVAAAITAHLNDNQFSALVSFAYNVGLGAFRSSSVLRAVNSGDFAAVPRRLNLWTKAGGRVLQGLVKRRAAEGQMFMRDYRSATLLEAALPMPSEYELDQIISLRGMIEPVEGKDTAKSTTVWSSIAQFGATLSALATGLSETARKAMWQAQEWYFVIPQEIWTHFIIASIGLGCMVWIIRERRKKAVDDGV
jgi:GH24 family phage-related lysozyme (muramidase)